VVSGTTLSDFPSLKAKKLLSILCRKPLNYCVIRRNGGSHRVLASDNYPRLIFAFHNSQEIPGSVVARILTKDVGLSMAEAKEVIK
jgi:predicted RNA binding protein YcfA (HicA-like mRNA interferase family)